MNRILESISLEKRRRSLFITNLVIATAVLLLEISFFLVLLIQDNIDQPLIEYLLCYLIIPSTINFLAVGTEYFVMKKFPKNDDLQNAMVTFTLIVICTVVATTHHVFANTLTIFCIPVLSSVVFCNKKLLRKAWLFSMVGMVVAMINRYLSRFPIKDKYFFLDLFIALSIVLLSWMIAKLIISLVSEQNKRLVDLATEANEAKKQALEANRAKSRFLASMSHEIRTPINGVLGMDSMILRECSDPEIREYAMNIQSAGKGLLSIINDILDFSKIESGKMEIVPVEYELFSLLNDCYNILKTRADENKLELRIENDPEMPARYVGDEIRIRQIITNLLSNAVKYTPQGYVLIKVNGKTADDGKYVIVISVKDTGVGISEENLKKLFNSFERLDEKQNRGIEGTGLGLTITKQLVELMNGTITVESEQGKGSEFTVEIPQIVRGTGKIGNFCERYHHVSNNETYREKFHAPNAHILVVDDVPMNLKVFCGLLKNTQMQIDTAESGAKCLELIEENRYDIIFLDHMMPEMNGIETFKRIKQAKNSPNTNTPVIMLTANAMSSAREEYFKTGFTDYLTKPIHETALENLILRYLSPDLIITDFADEENTPAEKQPADSKSLVEKLGDLLDTTSGMGYCMNDENFYLEIIRDYINSDRLAKINKAFEDNDLENYRISVHALKSTSLSIGANQLSEHAKQLEFAARNSDVEYIKANNDALIEEYTQMLANLKEILNG